MKEKAQAVEYDDVREFHSAVMVAAMKRRVLSMYVQ